MKDFESLDRFIFDKISESKLPGLSIAAVKNGEIIYKKAFGFRDLSKGLAATPETLYCIGSVTKSFTCLAIMKLQEEGLLNVEDRADRFLPFKLEVKQEPVKIWHLMTHSSGIPALAYAESMIRSAMKSADRWLPMIGYDSMFTFLDEAESWAHSKPGEKWFYLNEGYILLGHIIEKVSGEPYTSYVKKNILIPLSMMRSLFMKEEVDLDPNVATPYIVTKEGERIPSTYPYGAILSDGGLISNVEDMARYIMMYLDYGMYKETRLAREDSIREMMKPRVKTPDEPFISDYDRYYGYGLGINSSFSGYDLISHGGSVSTATAYMGFIPAKKIGVMVLANGSGYPLNYIGEYALALLLGEDPYKLPVFKYEKIQKNLEGVYETYKATMRAKVVSKGSLLALEIGDKYRDLTVPLVPVDWEGAVKIFHGISMDRRISAEFYEQEGDTYLIYERYKMKKVGKI
ncbi:MAG: serine hydrolase [Candidatus Bathyarchaeia archaeon]